MPDVLTLLRSDLPRDREQAALVLISAPSTDPQVIEQLLQAIDSDLRKTKCVWECCGYDAFLRPELLKGLCEALATTILFDPDHFLRLMEGLSHTNIEVGDVLALMVDDHRAIEPTVERLVAVHPEWDPRQSEFWSDP